MKYEVEQGQEIPEIDYGANRKYPFIKMRVGDSFFVPLEDVAHSKDPLSVVSSAASIWGKRKNQKYTTRTVRNDDYEVIGFRVWRID